MVLTLFLLGIVMFIAGLVIMIVTKSKKKKQILANRQANKAGTETTTAGTEITDD